MSLFWCLLIRLAMARPPVLPNCKKFRAILLPLKESTEARLASAAGVALWTAWWTTGHEGLWTEIYFREIDNGSIGSLVPGFYCFLISKDTLEFLMTMNLLSLGIMNLLLYDFTLLFSLVFVDLNSIVFHCFWGP